MDQPHTVSIKNSTSTSVRCRNCGEAMLGEYCHQCGQRELDVYVSDVAGETIQDLINPDSRFWATLRALVLQPGKLSADYFAGRRARYIPPVRLYLFVSFLVFLVASLTGKPLPAQSSGQITGDDTASQRGIYIPGTSEDGKREWITLREFLDTDSAVGVRSALPGPMQPLAERLRDKAVELEQDPSDWSEELDERIPQLLIVLVPAFALLVSLFYLRSPFHYMQHLIFALHCHTFAFALFLVTWPVRFLVGDARGWAALALLVYVPLAMHRAYRSGWMAAVLKGASVVGIYYGFVKVVGATMALTILLLL